ncbi:hypothetical protein [Williamsia sp.]|uniref:Rv0361 family membrane protein n=1 Tax=Williamsia sp. TaxID=1872085 RepID=UPI001A1F3C76|nr:hypothetical protein [Williamsia sp.]MBJ7288531.1 hypothetical protein [Williamsia sp.]
MVVLAVVGGAVGITVAATSGGGESQDGAIDKAVTTYTSAFAAGDVNALRSSTCQADAGRFAELGARGGPPTVRPKTTVTGVRTSGDDAAVTVSQGSAAPITVYFRKEGGAWKACPSAVSSFPTR